MLITTSRKPSQRTRSFCKSLDRVINSEYVNRGKMSLRDVLLKSSQLGFDKTALISETKGNPSKIDFYNEKGDIVLSMDVTVSITNSKGRLKTSELSMKSEMDTLNILGELLGIPKCRDILKQENILVLKEGDNERRALLEFYDSKGVITGPKIYIKDWRIFHD
ncbi:Brix domain-containing protein [Methanobacterium aggregans]|uniref:Brix domain-containing protein n=1 Tax=Methanobacterium aggregans TaxID=1615586 RepID=UPI001AE5B53B|nr:ribosomal biogenesis protein [Methanobacterium aggregans]MBP2045525.1 U3 small nucleolar ribonucleoprotein IMP4 [Methanobacterium aggregans]